MQLPLADGGFLYLATVLDLPLRRLAGWSVAEHMRTDLIIDTLEPTSFCGRRGVHAGLKCETLPN